MFCIERYIPIIDYEANLIKVEKYSIYIRTYSMGWLKILFFAPDYTYILVWELIFETFSHGSWFPALVDIFERDIQLSWNYPSVWTIMKIIFPYTRWIMTKLIRLVSYIFLIYISQFNFLNFVGVIGARSFKEWIN